MTLPDDLREQAEVLDDWTRAYPLDVFPVPENARLARNSAAAHVMREMALPQFAKDRDALLAAAERIEKLEAAKRIRTTVDEVMEATGWTLDYHGLVWWTRNGDGSIGHREVVENLALLGIYETIEPEDGAS